MPEVATLAEVSPAGPERAVPVEATLAWLGPKLATMGVTRVGMVTGLDRIGLPVAMAVRPNSRTIAVAQGKGTSVAAAKVAAIMETAEGFHAETLEGPLVRSSARALGAAAVDPERLPRVRSGVDADLGAARLLWVAGVDLARGESRYVPYELVHADYTSPPPEPPRFHATTNGLGAGNVMVEAQLHALFEVVERDAVACWRACGGPGAAEARPLDLADVPGTGLGDLLEAIAAADVEVAAWDVTSDIGLPVVVVLLVPRDVETSPVEPEIGAGCHLRPEIALQRALMEAVQARLTRISGARDDFEPRSYDAAARAARRRDARAWLARSRNRPVPWSAVAARWPAAERAPERDLNTVLAALTAAGMGPAVWVDLSRADVDLPVGRVVVAGLEGPWAPGQALPGPRARAMAR